MRLLFLNPVGEIGGAERVLLDLCASLRTHAPEVRTKLICFEEGPLLDAALAVGVEVEACPLPAALANVGDSVLTGPTRAAGRLDLLLRSVRTLGPLPGFARALGRSIRAWKPDLVHSNGIKTHLLGALVCPRRTPLVWHVHDYLSERPLVRHLLGLARRRASAAIAISESVRRDAERVLPGVPVHTVLNGIDTQRFSPGPAEPEWLESLAEGEPLPANEPVVRVGLIATYGRWKGHEVFLRAAAELLRAAPPVPVRFYIVGGPIYRTAGSQYSRSELEALAQELGITAHVRFIPFQARPERIYRTLDVVVHASTRPEPFGLTIAEAMSCGRATVVANAGGAAELFEEGLTAVGYTMGDQKRLAASITNLTLDASLRTGLGAAARARAVSRFDRARLGEQAIRIYEALRASAPTAHTASDNIRSANSRMRLR